jgi:H+-transporting ATPase
MTTSAVSTEATKSVPKLAGLSSSEAAIRLKKDGANAMPDISAHPLRNALLKFWAPVPWLLEAAIVLQVVLHKYVEAAVIAGLLIFNAALAYFQEGRAQATLTALKSRLALNAGVQRDGVWKTVPAAELVRGDLVKLSLGGVVAADVHLIDGSVLLDQSMLTGESLPVEAGAGADTYAGALVRRGEATAEVTATGVHTKFGRTAELVRTAHVVSSQQKAVLRIVRNLAIFNGGVILLIGGYAYWDAMPWSEVIPLLLTSVLAAIPVALPATFTLATALGARALAKLGVLPTRLSAVDEAATIDVLCSDKTGTLTRNELSVTSVRPMPGVHEAYLLGMAALASSEGGEDSVDAAIRSASSHKPASGLPKLNKFVPFDPAKKTSEATATDAKGSTQRVVKGAFTTVSGLTALAPTAGGIAEELEKKGFRVLAVAAGTSTSMQLIGLIALSDPPRADSSTLIAELKTLGVRTVMVTGDAPATAGIVAHEVGLDGAVCPPGPLPDHVKPEDFAVFASILPEGKFDLVKAFQKNGHAVGMCGAAPSADRHCRIDGDRCRQVSGRRCTDRVRAGRDCGGCQRRPGHISADSHLHPELGRQEDRAGVAAGHRPAAHWACGVNTHADGDRDGHRGLPGYVINHGQGAAVGDAEFLANRQDHDRGCPSRIVLPGLLYSRAVGGKI